MFFLSPDTAETPSSGTPTDTGSNLLSPGCSLRIEKKGIIVKKADIFVGVLILFVSASLFVMTQKFVGKVYTGYGPDRFPRFLAIVWSILGVILIFNAVRDRFYEENMKFTLHGLGRVLVLIGFTVAVLIGMNYVGFVPATMAYIFVVMSYLKERSLTGRFLTAVVVTLAVYFVFKHVMVIPLPEFSLFEAGVG